VNPNTYVDVRTVARLCAEAGLGTIDDCHRWLVREFEALKRVRINGANLAGYRDERGQWVVRKKRLVVVLGLTVDRWGTLKLPRERRGSLAKPTAKPPTKRLRAGDCLRCKGPCETRVIAELDADTSWNGQPHPELVAELTRHPVLRRARTIRVTPGR
jgi:hypothetical protein